MAKRLVILMILAGLASYEGWRRMQPPDAVEHDALRLYGNVDIRQVALGFRVGGRIQDMYFEEGDQVARGDRLAQLDLVPFLNESDLAAAEVLSASATLQKLLAGPRPQEIEQARALAHERRIALENAEREYQRRKELALRGDVAKEEADRALSAMQQAEARLASAEEALALALEGYRDEDILAARGQLQAAEARLVIAETRSHDAELFAPSDGVILTRVTEPGAIVGLGQTVYTLAIVTPVWVRAYIPEPELGRIRPGMKAEIFTDSHPERAFSGQIGYISPQAEFTPKSVETPELRTSLVYRLRVIVEDPHNELRQGMPVTIHIPLDDSERVSYDE